MTRVEMLYQMRQKGYKFAIEQVGSSKELTVKGPFTAGEGFIRHYSADWSDEEILVDAITDVVEWAGYRVVERLELCV